MLCQRETTDRLLSVFFFYFFLSTGKVLSEYQRACLSLIRAADVMYERRNIRPIYDQEMPNHDQVDAYYT